MHAQVRGGYTIAPLQEFKLNSSPESLITCIMKVSRLRLDGAPLSTLSTHLYYKGEPLYYKGEPLHLEGVPLHTLNTAGRPGLGPAMKQDKRCFVERNTSPLPS